MTLDLDAALAASITEAATAVAAQTQRDQAQAANPKAPRALPPIDKGDLTFDGYATTTRLCALCDTGIHLGTPIVRHWTGGNASHVNDAYHPACFKERTND